jgi:glycosyltransferase involved in cell wall biosynthesis
VVVDNGSEDASAALAEAAGARVVREERRGYGQACNRGLQEAQGRYLILGDADGTYDFEHLGPLVAHLSNGADMVLGNRLGGMLEPGAMPFLHRTIGTPVITLLLRLFAGSRVSDSQCGLRGIRKEAFLRLDLNTKGMEFASEMLLKASRQGLRIAEVPIPYRRRKGESKLRTLRDGWRHLRFLLLNSPTYAFVVPGLLFLALGLFSLAVTIFQGDGIRVGSLNWQPVFAGTILLVVGTNTLMLGLVSKLFAIAQGVKEKDWLVTLYRRHLGFERLLLSGVALLLLGLAADGFILVRWLADPSAPELLRVAVWGQTSLIVGANLAFGSVTAAIIDNRE